MVQIIRLVAMPINRFNVLKSVVSINLGLTGEQPSIICNVFSKLSLKLCKRMYKEPIFLIGDAPDN